MLPLNKVLVCIKALRIYYLVADLGSDADKCSENLL